MAIRDAALILAPRGAPEEIRTDDMVVNPGRGPMQSAEVFLNHVSARAIEAVCLLMVDSFDLVTLMSVIPCRCFVDAQNLSLRDASAKE